MDFNLTIAVAAVILCAVCAAGWFLSFAAMSSRERKIIAECNSEAASAREKVVELSSGFAAVSAQRDAARALADSLKAELNKTLEEKTEAEKSLSAASEKISALAERIESRAAEEKELRDKMAADFENLSNRLLESSRQKMSEANIEQLSLILNPLKNNIKDFRERVDLLNLESVKNYAGMAAQIENLLKMNARLGDEAAKLTRALRSNNKIAGNWGETVLQKILEDCGFKEGVHFRAQQSYADSDGEGKRLVPDFVIDLPNSRSIVVDSKLSLVDYAYYCSAEDAAARRASLEKFKKSVRAHLAEFAGKYNNLPDANCGFKMMFMPIEPAYDLIMREDAKIAFDAYESNVLIVGPVSVMAVLKFAEISLRNDALAKNTREIAAIGDLLYRRVSLFMEKFRKIGERISQLEKEYESATLTLSQGSKSVLGTAKRLGAKSSGDILELEEKDEKDE